MPGRGRAEIARCHLSVTLPLTWTMPGATTGSPVGLCPAALWCGAITGSPRGSGRFCFTPLPTRTPSPLPKHLGVLLSSRAPKSARWPLNWERDFEDTAREEAPLREGLLGGFIWADRSLLIEQIFHVRKQMASLHQLFLIWGAGDDLLTDSAG